TATSLDGVFAELMRWRWVPEVRTINSYHTHPLYIEALARSLEQTWARDGRAEKQLFSFHGIPRSYAEKGDPYHLQCLETGSLLATRLGLTPDDYAITFQSRLGPIEWLQPYTDVTVEAWGKAGVKSVQAICPGFSADCLETVDEVGREAAHSFHEAGGGTFTYVPALNDRPEHSLALVAIVQAHLWQD
ncbi:MAG: ferrochelatase, partial [Caldilineaceae bacterium]